MLADGFPVVKLDASKLDLSGRMPACRLLFKLKLTASTAEARRIIEQGGVTVATEWTGYRKMPVHHFNEMIVPSNGIIVRIGLHRVAMIQMEQTMDGIFEPGQVWRAGDVAYEVILIATMEDFGGDIIVYEGNDGVKAQSMEKWRERIERHGFKLWIKP